MENLKVLFFDMGNTILNFHNGPSDTFKDQIGAKAVACFLSSKLGREISSTVVMNEFINKWFAVIPLRKTLHKEFPIDTFLDPFLKKLDLSLSAIEKIEIMKQWDSGYQKYLTVENETIEALKSILI